MPRVNFYLLKRADEGAREGFACRLAEKLAREGHVLQLFTDDEQSARELDRLLWSFGAESFVPHALAGSSAAADAAVLISWHTPLPCPTLLNLSNRPLAAIPQLQTIAEFVLNEESAKAEGRQRWQHYKQAACELHHHEIPA